MAMQIENTALLISQLEITGLRIAPLDNIPTDCTNLVPILIPEPLGFVTNLSTVRDTFGPAATAQKTVEYDLNYTLCYASVAAGRTGLDYYRKFTELVEDIVDEVLDNDDLGEIIDIAPQGTVDFGVVKDPAGNVWQGCGLVFHVVEYR